MTTLYRSLGGERWHLLECPRLSQAKRLKTLDSQHVAEQLRCQTCMTQRSAKRCFECSGKNAANVQPCAHNGGVLVIDRDFGVPRYEWPLQVALGKVESMQVVTTLVLP